MDAAAQGDAQGVEATRILLAQMNVSPTNPNTGVVGGPTFNEIIPLVRASLTAGTLRTCNTYLTRLENTWGSRRIGTIPRYAIKEMAIAVRTNSTQNRAGRGGGSAMEHFLSTIRCVYRYAEDNNWIHPEFNPTTQLTTPRRQPSNRYAIPAHQLAEICEAAATTGNDPELDALLLRLHTETACRRSGALALRPCDLDTQQCLIHLREKGGTDRWQPISPTLMRHLLRHATERHSPHHAQLLRYHNGKPITTRRYDHLWTRIGTYLPWVALHGMSTHWLRHTTLTWVERNFGYAIARAYAGHRSQTQGTTTTYVKATLQEVATALSILTREAHPLASPPPVGLSAPRL